IDSPEFVAVAASTWTDADTGPAGELAAVAGIAVAFESFRLCIAAARHIGERVRAATQRCGNAALAGRAGNSAGIRLLVPDLAQGRRNRRARKCARRCAARIRHAGAKRIYLQIYKVQLADRQSGWLPSRDRHGGSSCGHVAPARGISVRPGMAAQLGNLVFQPAGAGVADAQIALAITLSADNPRQTCDHRRSLVALGDSHDHE